MKVEIVEGAFAESGNIVQIGGTAYLAVQVGSKLYGVSHEESNWIEFSASDGHFSEWVQREGLQGVWQGLHAHGSAFYPNYTSSSWGEKLFDARTSIESFAKEYQVDPEKLKEFIENEKK